MEMLNAFESYQNNTKGIEDIVEEFEKEKEAINKKIHIFKVLEIGNIIQELIDNKQLNSEEISAITISYGYDYDYGNEINLDFINIEKTDSFKKYLPKELIHLINDTSSIINGFKNKNINEIFTQNTEMKIRINDNFKEKFIDLMLSSELKNILNYNELQIDLADKEKTSKKMKI